jgi:golgi-specific brefeldin A-resistance guanine nucleotide exchange factor 1
MSRDDQLVVTTMDSALSSAPGTPLVLPRQNIPDLSVSSRMQYRSRPVSVAVDPVSLVISESIAITSAIQKSSRSSNSFVSAILGGSPNIIQLVPPEGPAARRQPRTPTTDVQADGAADAAANRWGLRGKKGKSMQDNPLISGFGRLRHKLAGVKGRASHWDIPLTPVD